MNTEERLRMIEAHWHHLRGYFDYKTMANLGPEIEEMSAMLESALMDQETCVMEKVI